MMKKSLLAVLAAAWILPASAATTLDVGYKAYTSSTKDDNGGAYDQPFVKLTHFNKADWGTLLAYLKLENPGEMVDAQHGKAGKLTVKSLVIVDKQIGDSAYNLWAQNFLSSNRTVMEDNLYLGLTTNQKFGDLFVNAGAGVNYTAGSLTPTQGEFDGISGGAAVINLRYPLQFAGFKHSLSVNYEGQFGRDSDHQALYGYESYGHQIITTFKTSLTDNFYSKLHITQFDSWGATPNDGIEYGIAFGFKF